MPTVKISATSIEELIRKLTKVKDYAQYRNSVGFPLYQYDEEWMYATQPEGGNICPYCLDHANRPLYDGYTLQSAFPSRYRLEDRGTLQVVYPNVHEQHEDVNGRCHCSLTLLHPVETFAARATRDLEELIQYG